MPPSTTLFLLLFFQFNKNEAELFIIVGFSDGGNRLDMDMGEPTTALPLKDPGAKETVVGLMFLLEVTKVELLASVYFRWNFLREYCEENPDPMSWLITKPMSNRV